MKVLIFALIIGGVLNAQPPGFGGPPKYYNGNGMKPKSYQYCPESEFYCEGEKWVGLFGSELIQDTKNNESAHKLAKGFQRASIVKAAAMVSMPIFLGIGISKMNEDTRDENGSHDPEKSPKASSIIVTSMAGVGFLTYVISNVVEAQKLGQIMKTFPEIKPPRKKDESWAFSFNYQSDF